MEDASEELVVPFELTGDEDELTLDQLQNLLGAALINLIDRCIALPTFNEDAWLDEDAWLEDSFDQVKQRLDQEAKYIHDNATHVRQLMTRARDMQTGLL